MRFVDGREQSMGAGLAIPSVAAEKDERATSKATDEAGAQMRAAGGVG